MRMRRVMVLEDEATVALHEGAILHDMTGADIVTCYSVVDGIEKAASGEIDLAILDIMLPDGSGFDVADELRAHSTPYIFVSAVRRTEIPLHHRAAPVLSKPFDESELRAALARLIVPGPSRRAREVRSGPMT